MSSEECVRRGDQVPAPRINRTIQKEVEKLVEKPAPEKKVNTNRKQKLDRPDSNEVVIHVSPSDDIIHNSINIHQYTNDANAFEQISNKFMLDRFSSHEMRFFRYNIMHGVDTEVINDSDAIEKYLSSFGKVVFLTFRTCVNIYNDCMCVIEFNRGIHNILIYSNDLNSIKTTHDDFMKHINEILVNKQKNKVYFTWYTIIDGRTVEYEKTEYLDDIFHKECYPYIDTDEYIKRYLESTAPILILMGPPGTGKTRFIRNILKEMASKNLEDYSISCLYTSSKDVIESGNIYLDLVFNEYDSLILEDIDYHMSSRRDGNTSLYNLLSVSNGLLVNCMKEKKIILSTNLPNTKNIDEALIRPGRCFDILSTRKLEYSESQTILKLIGKEKEIKEGEKYSLADLYN